ncbi:MAG: helix-turn-helix transcriptional regulator [Chitinophagaceae bacterium]|nr:helix-turn-helix transcriptional regulator [Chitinophagaceae bacterium]
MEKHDYKKLKELREEKKITQKEMSNLLNMTQSNYSKLENGKKKIDSLQTLENLAKALEMTTETLMGVLLNQENLRSSGIKQSELIQLQRILKENPIRKDEFVLFSSEVLELEKHDFKDHYSGVNLEEYDEDLCRYDNGQSLSMAEYPLDINIMIADMVEIGFEFEKNKLNGVSIWLGEKKLGVLKEEHAALANQLINSLLISRVALIGNEDSISGYFNTYMKVVFIATNAVAKSSQFGKGRFSSLSFLSQKEIDEIDNIEG